jgi:hypothetical protein
MEIGAKRAELGGFLDKPRAFVNPDRCKLRQQKQ